MTAVCITLLSAACLLVPLRNLHAQPVTLRYGQIPSTVKTISALSFYVGQPKGFFAQEGINLEMMPIEGGAANMVIASTKVSSISRAPQRPT